MILEGVLGRAIFKGGRVEFSVKPKFSKKISACGTRGSFSLSRLKIALGLCSIHLRVSLVRI
jgi:hypothetical protein